MNIKKLAQVLVVISAWTGLIIVTYNVINGKVPPQLEFRLANLVSYFTIQSNIIVAVVSTIILLKPNFDSKWFRLFEFGGLVNIAITMVVVIVILSKLQTFTGLALVADNFIHYITPTIYILNWIVFRPKAKFEKNFPFIWVAYPIGYAIYSLVRGSMVGWYPYPFIDASVLTPFELARNSVLMAVFFFFVAYMYLFVSKKLKG